MKKNDSFTDSYKDFSVSDNKRAKADAEAMGHKFVGGTGEGGFIPRGLQSPAAQEAKLERLNNQNKLTLNALSGLVKGGQVNVGGGTAKPKPKISAADNKSYTNRSGTTGKGYNGPSGGQRWYDERGGA